MRAILLRVASLLVPHSPFPIPHSLFPMIIELLSRTLTRTPTRTRTPNAARGRNPSGNPKSSIRNLKQIRNPKMKTFAADKTTVMGTNRFPPPGMLWEVPSSVLARFGHSHFCHANLLGICCFGFRISNMRARLRMFGTKSEIRSTEKWEKGRKGKRRTQWHAAGENLLGARPRPFCRQRRFWISNFGFRICLGFRYWDFGFPVLVAAAGRV